MKRAAMKLRTFGEMFALDEALLARARAGRIMALDPAAIGSGVSLPSEPPGAPSPTTDGVLVINIDGPIAQRAKQELCGYLLGYDAITAQLQAGIDDPNVKAILLQINSPGGDAAGMLEAVRAMRAMALGTSKPIAAFADECATSAAYAIACVATDGIFLPPEGQLGSIGVLAVHSDISQKLAGKGIATSVFRSPARKAEGLPVEPLTDAARADMQARVDAMAASFAAFVAGARGMTTDAVMGLDGLAVYGQKAVDVGLATGLASFDQTYAQVASMGAARALNALSAGPSSPAADPLTKPIPRYPGDEFAPPTPSNPSPRPLPSQRLSQQPLSDRELAMCSKLRVDPARYSEIKAQRDGMRTATPPARAMTVNVEGVDVGLSESELETCRAMGLDVTTYAKNRLRHSPSRSAR